MNWITHFLKNNSGKLDKVSLLGGIATVGAMAITVGGYQHDVAKYEGPDRAVTMGYGPDYANMSTMSRDVKGELTSMPAYLQGRGGTDGIRFGRQPDQFSSPISENFDAGVAAQIGGMEGLSQGGSEAGFDRIQPAARASMGTPQGNNYNMGSSPAGRSASGSSSGSAAGASADARGGSFSRASAPQSSGSESLSSSGPIGGGRAAAPTAGGTRGGSNGGNYELTASMPTSNSMAALTRANTGNRASFGGQRDVRARKGQRIKGGGSLKELADTSAQIARKGTDAGANAGAKPFLNGGMVGGGVTFGDGNVGAGTSGNSNDFNSISTDQLQSNLQKKNDELQEDLEKERNARKALFITIVALLAAAAAAAWFMYNCFLKAKKALDEATFLEADAAALRKEAATCGTWQQASALIAQAQGLEARAKTQRVLSASLNKKGWLLFAAASAMAAGMLEESLRFAFSYHNWGFVPIAGIGISAGVVGSLFYLKARAVTDAVATDISTTLREQIMTKGWKAASNMAGNFAQSQMMNQIGDVFSKK